MRLRAAVRICALVLVGALAGHGLARAEPRDFIHADGARLVDGRGNQFDIKGINLGNWLVPEGYMFKFKHALSPMEIGALFDDLLGREAAAKFWARFRDVYIAKDDIDFIKKVGFNTVRVPLDWRLFAGPGDECRGGRRSGGRNDAEGEGWALLDRLVQWCHAAGLRVIVDLHAAPGGQTGVNHDNGPGFPLTFYVPQYRRMTIALWQKIAAHYRDETAILGYDLVERADFALQRRGVSQSAAGAVISRHRGGHSQRRSATTPCCSAARSGTPILRCSTSRSTTTPSTRITSSGLTRAATGCRSI